MVHILGLKKHMWLSYCLHTIELAYQGLWKKQNVFALKYVCLYVFSLNIFLKWVEETSVYMITYNINKNLSFVLPSFLKDRFVTR